MLEMKDSGVKWIGEIPKDWEMYYLKHLFQMFAGGDIDEYDFSDEYTEQTPYPIYSNSLENKGLFGYTSKYRFSGKTFTVTGRGDVGKAVARNDAYYPVVRLLVCVPKQKDDTRYFTYCVNSADILGEQTAMAQLTTQKLGANKFPRPNIKEQQLIAVFLDEKVKKIDEILSNLNSQIDILNKYKKSLITETVTKGLNSNVEIKDSGIDWIGMIPKQWKIQRMQDIGEYKKGPFGSAITLDMFVDKGENTYKVYEQKNAINRNETLGWYYIDEKDFKLLKDFEVFPDDIIVSCAGTIGKCHIMPETMEKGIINQALMRITLNKNVNNFYFLYLFDIVLERISEKYSNGSAIKNIPPFSILKKYNVCTPPTEEQEKIVNFLDEKCSQIDELIVDKQKQIEQMEKYKKSLIYEYVTGKKRVKGAEELYG